MGRVLKDWLESYIEYAGHSEAPRHFHYWCGVSAVAACLQRRVYFDQSPDFIWYPNFFIVLVAPAGITKSTSADKAIQLLNQVPGVFLGPGSVSWQRLIAKFEEAKSSFIDAKRRVNVEQRAITLFSSELGNLILPNDREMLDMLTNLYDCRDFDRSTHAHGDEKVRNPWFNLVGCTTPTWISTNLPDYMVGSGLVSRILWVSTDHKAKLIAYPKFSREQLGIDTSSLRKDLIHDLIEISDLNGEFDVTEAAVEWGEAWYERHNTIDTKILQDQNFKGYVNRKQGHIHKLAMVLAASKGDKLLITKELLQEAERQVTALEENAGEVIRNLGKSNNSNYSDKLVEFVLRHGFVTGAQAYEHVRVHFPKLADYEAILKGLLRSGVLVPSTQDGKLGLMAGRKPDE